MKNGSDKTQGLSLLEVLVALAVFSVGILGLVKYQIYALHYQQHAWSVAVAHQQMQSYFERMLANPNNPSQESRRWQQETKRLIPTSKTQITTGRIHTITFNWFNVLSQSQQRLSSKRWLS